MSNNFRLAILFTACISVINAAQLYESVEPHMGTLFRIKLYAKDESTAKAAFKAGFARIDDLDRIFSDYKPDSELNIASQRAADKPVHISNDLARVLEASQRISDESDGAFDITVGRLTKLWRESRRTHQLPSVEALAAARAKCDYRKVHVDINSRTLRLDASGIELDLGGIAKGYAAEETVSELSKLGITSALVAASGDLAFSDAPPGQPGWKIGIDSFDSADKPFTRVFILANAAVSTSGGTEQYLEIHGKRYSHILDPSTGMGLEREIAVTTVSRDGMRADAAATAVSVLGRKKGMAFIEQQPDLAALIVENSRSFESTRLSLLKEFYASR